MPQEKLQTMTMQNLGEVKEVFYGICASRELMGLLFFLILVWCPAGPLPKNMQ